MSAMTWGYRLEALSARDALHVRSHGKCCSAAKCGESPQFLSAYRYRRANGRAVTVSRPLCTKHARRFSMKYSLAWPDMLRRTRRPITGSWVQLAA